MSAAMDQAPRELTGQEKRALLAALLREKAQKTRAAAPLSHNQKALWLLYRRAPDTAAYNTAFAVRVRSAIDTAALRKALQTLVDRHAALRTTFETEHGKPIAVTHGHREAALTVIDATAWSDELVDQRVAEDYRRPFDLEHGPLLRVSLYRRGEASYVLLLAFHHIVCDAWSMWMLMHELSVAYPAALAGHPAELPPVAAQYSDFVRWQNQHIDSPEGERLWHYWRDKLAGELPVLDLPTDRPRPPVQSLRGASHFFQIDGALAERLVELGKAQGATLYMSLLAVFHVLLHRYSGQEDVIVGSPVAGRNHPDMASAIGYFANPLPVRANLSGNPGFREFLSQIRHTVLEALAHQDMPFPLIVERLQPKRDPSRWPVMEALFVLQRPPQSEQFLGLMAGEQNGVVNWGGLEMEPFGLAQMEGQFDLTLEVVEGPSALACVLKYNPDLFLPETVARMAGHYRTLIESVIDDPGQRIGHLPLLTEAERRQILETWQDTAVAYPLERCLHHWIEDQVARAPDRCAVRMADGGGAALSYGELDRRANQLARHLAALGVGPEAVVGVLAERSLELMVALLAILKAGAAYLPLDPEYPRQRLAFMVEDSGVSALLTQARRAERLDAAACPVVRLDADWPAIARQNAGPLAVNVGPDNLAYVIYTSGSTGRPKGAENTHRAICNRLLWMQDEYRLDGADRVLQKTPFSFDVSVWEFFWPLMTGATLVMARPGGHRERDYLVDAIVAHGVTTLHFVPSMLQVFLDAPAVSRCRGVLRRVICSGEALPLELQQRFFERLDAPLFNLYGPTEAAIDVTHWACQRDTELRTVPIGKPIANIQIYILDPRQQPVPVGVPGELHIGGVGLARGYRNRPELTAERFIQNPLTLRPGDRLYRTGDLCRWLPDGNIEYLQRIDFQVKLRGFRIELGEIEAALCAHPEVREAVVTVREDQPGNKRLVAYVAGRSGFSPTPPLEPADHASRSDFSPTPPPEQADVAGRSGFSPMLPPEQADVVGRSGFSPTLPPEQAGRAEARPTFAAFLKDRLPDYMVPSAFVFLDALPLSPSGKVDRAALPAPAGLDAAGAVAAPPRNEAERRVAGIWREVLRLPKPGIHDNFFDLGGHSLLLAEVQTRLAAAFGRAPSMVEMFQFPTIHALAGFYAESEIEPAPAVRDAPAQAAATADIAIIGMAGRFPGADDVDALWRNLCEGVESIAFFDDERLKAAGVPEALRRDPDYVGAFGLLSGVEDFDADYFGIPPREAELTDAQHRLLLECAVTALEHAGHDPSAEDRRYGLFAGVGLNRYLINHLLPQPGLLDTADSYQLMLGNDKDFAPTRVSYKLNLKGPSVSVQTACSTSLVAVHMACRSLLAGECDTALAGGASVTLPQDRGYLYREGMILSPDGHCRPFDVDARGIVGGSGVALVVLKRLDAALADGDTVHAVIKGSAINNDGAVKAGYTAPGVDGQAAVIAAAQAVAGVAPDSIGYIEAHGTGTPLGDPIEVAALSRVFRAKTRRTGYCALGSVKSNLGHLDTAAGVTGLIKAALAVKHGLVPPSLHFREANPALRLAETPFFVPTALRPWQTDGQPRRAGVSSFGIGGTNAHAVLEEAPALGPSGPGRAWQLLPLSAHGATALDDTAERLARHLRLNPGLDLADTAFTLAVGRRALASRRVLVCRTAEEAASALPTSCRSGFSPTLPFCAPEGRTEVRPTAQSEGRTEVRPTAQSEGRTEVRPTAQSEDRTEVRPTAQSAFLAGGEAAARSVAFMFTGQGAQYAGMAAGLYEGEAVFREQVDRCAALLEPHLKLDIRALLFPASEDQAEANARLESTALAQPALFVIEYALARVWMAWGVQPDALIGHSLGEYVAACLAGVWRLEDALALVAARAALMQAQPGGAMLAVSLPEAEIRPWLDAPAGRSGFSPIPARAVNGVGLKPDLPIPAQAGHSVGLKPDLPELAAVNADHACVVAGSHEAIAELARRLEARDIPCRRLHTSHAFHSAMMEAALAPFLAELRKVAFNPPGIPFVSNLTGTWIEPTQATDPEYWAGHLRHTVRFADGLATLLDAPERALIEVGPGNTLANLALRHPRRSESQPVATSLRHPREDEPDTAHLLKAAGNLWVSGVALDWAAFYAGQRRHRLALPTYPFQRRRYWIEPPAPGGRAVTAASSEPAYQANLDDWFYLPSWQRTPPPVGGAAPGTHWLLCMDDIGVGASLAERLTQQGSTVTRVYVGERFARRADGAFELNPTTPDDYESLFDTLARAGGVPDGVAHLWNLTSPDAPALDVVTARGRSFHSLVFLARALGERDSAALRRLAVVSNGVQRVTGEEWLDPGKALLLGPVAVIPQEYGQLRCLAIDLDWAPRQHDRQIDLLLADLAGDFGETAIVAYRGAYRWAQRWQKWSVASGDKTDSVLKTESVYGKARPDGAYLITGGLGGVGLALAEWLARAAPGVRLALLSRSGGGEATASAAPEAGQRSLDELCFLRIAEFFRQQGFDLQPGQQYRHESLRQRLGVLPKFDKFLAFFLRVLAEEGIWTESGGVFTVNRALPTVESIAAACRELHGRYPELAAVDQLLSHCARHYGPALSGEIEAIGVLYPDGRLDLGEGGRVLTEQFSQRTRHIDLCGDITRQAALAAAQNRPFRILEVGGGNGELTQALMQRLRGVRVEYCFTDLGRTLVRNAERKAAELGLEGLRFAVLDISRDPAGQGFESGSFDWIVALDVVHATPDIAATLGHLRGLLAPEGRLCLLESIQARRHLDMIWGLAEGWWYFEDASLRQHSPLIDIPTWMVALRQAGFPAVQAWPAEGPARAASDFGLMIAATDAAAAPLPRPVPDGDATGPVQALQALGAEVMVVRADVSDPVQLDQALADIRARFGAVRGVIHAAGIPGGGTLRLKPYDESEREFAAKVDGSLHLASRLAGTPLDFFVLCSSVTSVLGGFGQVAYAAASAFQDALAEALAARGQCGRVVAVDWDRWRGLGMAAAVEARHFDITGATLGGGMSAAQGAEVFGRILAGAAEPRVLVCSRDFPALVGLSRRWHAERIEAEVGGPLTRHPRPALANDYAAPVGETESLIAGIWQEELGIAEVGRHDEFFALGGDSLLAIKLASRLRLALDWPVNVKAIYDAPTVAGLAAYVAAARWVAESDLAATAVEDEEEGVL